MSTQNPEHVLLQALHLAEQGAAEGLGADRAVSRAALTFHVDARELRDLWLQKAIACEQARFSREGDK